MIVLDTHVLIWMDADDAALGPQARVRIEQAWRAGSGRVRGSASRPGRPLHRRLCGGARRDAGDGGREAAGMAFGPAEARRAVLNGVFCCTLATTKTGMWRFRAARLARAAAGLQNRPNFSPER